MKTTIAAILIATASVVHANLIDLTPLGFDPAHGLPPAYFELGKELFFDQAAHGVFNLPEGKQYLNGWVSRYGVLNGGQYFFTNLFAIGNSPNAQIWWNFNNSAAGYSLGLIDVFGRKSDGSTWENIYMIPQGERFLSLEHQLVTLDGMTTIMGISFYGFHGRSFFDKPAVPDSGGTLLLLSLGLAALLLTNRQRKLISKA
jgi:hypothetical protein